MSFLSNSWGKLFYEKRGDGKNFTLIFHGFGQSHKDMLAFEKIRRTEDTYIYVDMFYHGRSIWKSPNVILKKEHWKIIVEQLCDQLGIISFKLIGFSMGGKLSLLTYEVLPDRISGLTLIGPDGIKTGKWYSTSNYPDFFSGAFKQVIFTPEPVFSLFKGMKKAKLVDKSIYKFITTQMETRSKRGQVFFVWKVFGRINLEIGKIIKHARERQTPINIFVGKYDAMITEENLQKFSLKIPQLNLVVLPVGHGQLTEATTEYLSQNNNQFDAWNMVSRSSISMDK